MLAQQEVIWEVHDHFQKQTYRNRCYICTDRGKHRLNLPVKHLDRNKGRPKYSEVEIEHPSYWKRVHWRTLEAAYRGSPFFEFYEEALKPLFEGNEKHLYSFNLNLLKAVGHCLGLQIPDKTTETFEKCPSRYFDARFLVGAKKELCNSLESYTQVFAERHGFVANLSILDLLFNEGPQALAYLKRQSLDFLHADGPG